MWVKTSAAAISTSSTARTLCRVAVRIRVAQEAPAHAPTRLPASRLTTTGQCEASVGEGDGDQPSRQRGKHHDQAHRLVQDDRLQRGEPEQADQQRQPELRATEPDHAAEHTDRCAGGRSGNVRSA